MVAPTAQARKRRMVSRDYPSSRRREPIRPRNLGAEERKRRPAGGRQECEILIAVFLRYISGNVNLRLRLRLEGNVNILPSTVSGPKDAHSRKTAATKSRKVSERQQRIEMRITAPDCNGGSDSRKQRFVRKAGKIAERNFSGDGASRLNPVPL